MLQHFLEDLLVNSIDSIKGTCSVFILKYIVRLLKQECVFTDLTL